MKSLTELKRQGDGEVVSLQIGSPITAEILSLYVRHCMLRPAKLFFETTPLFMTALTLDLFLARDQQHFLTDGSAPRIQAASPPCRFTRFMDAAFL